MEIEEIQAGLRQIVEDHGSVNYNEISPMEDAIMMLLRKIEWFPLENEWCWFNNAGRSATVSQFQEHRDGIYYDAEGSEWEECLPFEGPLPKHLEIGVKVGK